MKTMNEKKMTGRRAAAWQNTQENVKARVRNFMRFALETSDSDVFYFSLGGMVMPLSVSK